MTKIHARPYEIFTNVNKLPDLGRKEGCVLKYTSTEELHRLAETFTRLRGYLFEDKPFGSLISACDSFGQLFTPRDNSTFPISIRIDSYSEGVIRSHTGEHCLNSPFIALVRKGGKIKNNVPETYPEYIIPTEGGVLRVRGPHRGNMIPLSFVSSDVVINFDARGVAKEIYRPPHGTFFLKVDGELFRSGHLDGMGMEWYISNCLKSLTIGDQTWKFTRGDKVTLQDRVAGAPFERVIGSLFVAKNIKTKERRIVPTLAGVVSVIHRNLMLIKEANGEYPPELLKDIKGLQHVEARRILMNMVGMEKFLTNAKTLDIDIDKKIHRALVLDLDDNQKYLICHDGSTEKQYVLSVPDVTMDRTEITTCAEASATLSALSVDVRLPWQVRNTIMEIANSDEFVAES